MNVRDARRDVAVWRGDDPTAKPQKLAKRLNRDDRPIARRTQETRNAIVVHPFYWIRFAIRNPAGSNFPPWRDIHDVIQGDPACFRSHFNGLHGSSRC